MQTEKQRERLVELLRKSGASFERALPEEIADRLLAEGVIVPPCKVGETVYKIFNGKIAEMRAVAIPLLISSCGAHLSVTAENRREACISLELDDFGKTVFLTREEAEKALKEREGEG